MSKAIKYIACKELSGKHKKEIMCLWNKEYPTNLSYIKVEEFGHYLSKLPDQKHILIIDNEEVVKGWYFDFIRDGARWFAMIIDERLQGQGIGRRLLAMAKQGNKELNGWVTNHNNYVKLNGEYYKSPIAFYEKNGFDILYDAKLETEKLSAIKIKWKNKDRL